MKKLTTIYCIAITLLFSAGIIAQNNAKNAACGAFIFGVNSVKCNGDCNGTATVIGNGGTAPYTYSWSSGQTTGAVTNFCAGVFTVTVTDATGCITLSSATITEAPVLTATFSAFPLNAKCNAPGIDTVFASGGATPYAYSWSPGGNTTRIIKGGPGTYSVRVSDSRGCIKTYTTTINADPGAISLTATQTNVTCNGAKNGSIQVVPTGGTGVYTYTWSGAQTTASLTGLANGNYTVTVTDAGGCSSSQVYVITQPAALTLGSGPGGLTVTAPKCNGDKNGSVSAPTSGGTSPYTYSWSDGATGQTDSPIGAGIYTVSVNDANGCTATRSATVTEPVVLAVTATSAANSATANPTGGTTAYTYIWSNGGTTKTVTGLGLGTYTVTVTDKNGCTATTTTTISALCNVTTTGIKNTLCNGDCNGAATAVPNGTSPYTFAWSSGQTTAGVTNFCAGTFTVTVTDANSCSATSSATITEPAVLGATLTSVNATCNTPGTASAAPSGGIAPYTYNWQPGAKTTSSITGGAGIYTITIRDANGCSKIFTDTIKSAAGAITITGTKTNVTCNGAKDGSIQLTTTGGTGTYTYTWSGGQTTAALTGLANGSYTVTATDANGCTSSQPYTITQPATLSMTLLANWPKCNGDKNGSASAQLSGGTSPYTYSWSDGASGQTDSGIGAGIYTVTMNDANGCSLIVTTTVTEPSVLAVTATATANTATANPTGGTTIYTYSWSNGGTTKTVSGLALGSYTVTVTDKNGCTAATTATISALCNVTATGLKNATCNGTCNGTATASPVGTAPYTYSWSSGQTAGAVTDLCAGTFIVTVTDANSCASTTTVTITEPTAITATHTSTNAQCNIPGSASITPSGGTGTYNYTWQPGAKTTSTITGGAGIYTVVVRDVNACTKTFIDTIGNDPGAITSAASQTNITCFGAKNGTIQVTPTGGTGAYTFSWSSGQTSSSLTALTNGNYTVTIADANGCTSNRSFVITQPTVLGTAINVTKGLKCHGDKDGSAFAQLSGGTPPYTYTWSDGATTQTNSGLAGGTFTVTMTDANGCSATTTSTEAEPAVLNVSASSTTNSATAFATGGTIAYTYTWSNGGTAAIITGLNAGTYAVTVTDKNGCTASSSTTILTTGMNAANSDNGFKIYPNPVSAMLTVVLTLENTSAVKITLINILGETVYDENLTANKMLKKSIDTSGLADGVYFINVKSENQSHTQKFIVNK